MNSNHSIRTVNALHFEAFVSGRPSDGLRLIYRLVLCSVFDVMRFLSLSCNGKSFIWTYITKNWWAREAFSRADEVPENGNGRKAGKDNRCIIHARGCYRNGDWHAEKNDGKSNPANCGDIDKKAEFAETEGGMLCRFSSTNDVDQNGDAITRAQTYGGDTSEGIEGGGRTKIYQAEKTVDDGREDQTPERDIESLVDARPDPGAGNSAISGKGICAAGCGGKGAGASKEQDTQDQEQQTEAAAS